MSNEEELEKVENNIIKKEILSIPPTPLPENLSKKQYNHSQICDFTLTKKLGEGTFSIVRLGINKQTNEKVAIKEMLKNKIIENNDKNRLEREIKILKKNTTSKHNKFI